MTNLTIDIGNTRIKIAIFVKNELAKIDTIDIWKIDSIKSFITSYKLDYIVISSVRKNILDITNELKNLGAKIIILSHKSNLPFQIDYLTPETLGIDRIAALLGAIQIKPSSNFIVIDIGTCITYDLLIDNHFIGGNIAPGIQMRATAMHQLTEKLPLVVVEKSHTELGLTTNEAINNGAFWGTIYEIKGIISRYKQKYPDIECIITGGGANIIFEKLTKEVSDIYFDKHLILRGLNSIIPIRTENI